MSFDTIDPEFMEEMPKDSGLTFMDTAEYKKFLSTQIPYIPKQRNMRYTTFRAEIYKIVDKAMDMAIDPKMEDSIHIELEDDIDELFFQLKLLGMLYG